MDGLLVIDKPAGPTSHDVVARVRRVLKERRVGHTGTLDPAATGVLPLVVGRATRLAQFLTAADKAYDAVVRLGFSTNTYDAAGEPVGGRYDGPLPDREAIDAALNNFRGEIIQRPPAYSAKKIAGRRSYALAREADALRQEAAGGLTPAVELPAPVRVTASAIEIVRIEDDCIALRVECSAGFYVRSLAHDVGQQLGTGAHLLTLRRTRSGDACLADALPLGGLEGAEIDRDAANARAAAALIPLSRMLPAFRAFTLTDIGVRHAGQGRNLEPADFADAAADSFAHAASGPFRLLDPAGNLVGLATSHSSEGLLHPFVILV